VNLNQGSFVDVNFNPLQRFTLDAEGGRPDYVAPTSIVTTTERTFVIRVNAGVAQWVNVSRGARVGDLIEVFGALKDGDTIVRRRTDEIREGAKVNAQPAKAS